MADRVFINGRAAVHAGSCGKSVAFPDVCLCPPAPPGGPVVLPLTNTAKAADLAGCAATVTIDGHEAVYADAPANYERGRHWEHRGVVVYEVEGRYYRQYNGRWVYYRDRPSDLREERRGGPPGPPPPPPGPPPPPPR